MIERKKLLGTTAGFGHARHDDDVFRSSCSQDSLFKIQVPLPRG